MGLITEAQTAFTEIYDKDLWGLATGEWSAARPGEEPEGERQARLVALIESLIALNRIRSVVEFGCGYWSYAGRIDWSGVEYDGFDVVEDVVASNNREHGRPNIRFHRIVDGVELPQADLLISKDVLQHLPTAHVQYYLAAFDARFKFMLIGNDVVPADNLNGDTRAGGYRALRLELPPFDRPNAVLQSWTSSDFGVHTVKNFCLLLGSPGGEQQRARLADDALDRAAVEPVRRGLVRSAARGVVVSFPPLARLTGWFLERVRGRTRS